MKSTNYEVRPATPTTPRLHRWVQHTSKNDPENKKSASERITVVACICLETTDGQQRQNFLDHLTVAPFCECIMPCPFQHIKNYVDMIPYPCGHETRLQEQRKMTITTKQ